MNKRTSALIVGMLLSVDFAVLLVRYMDMKTEDVTIKRTLEDKAMISRSAVVNLISGMFSLILGMLGLYSGDARSITLATVVIYIDAAINIIRSENIVVFSHSILQLCIAHMLSQYKKLITSFWAYF